MPGHINTPTNGSANGAAGQSEAPPKELVDEMQRLFGKHTGYRTTHAKGLLVEGIFTPTEQAKTLSVAAHFNKADTPIIARFSVGGGIPHIPDADDGATPKGLAIRFLIDENTHTDLVSHTFNGFATRTGEDFLAFLKVFRAFQTAKAALDKAKAGGGDTTKETADFKAAAGQFQAFLGTHPSAAVFVGSPKPNPLNYGTITYWEPNTHVLTNADGKVTNVRYRLDPADGEHLYPNDPAQLKKLDQSYLEEDLETRFPAKPIVFTIQAHIANDDDVLDDATVPYKSTTFVPVGKLVINKVSDDNVAKQQQIAFSPTPDRGGIAGIAASQDPLIQVRRGVYYISADQRRHEKQVE
ncbi:catalase-like domain-containing protein [Boeremia exigua]|uniref:catalase-like domain-containing protein n=1 Tax=Boeremia exigua TaxID=749465 RepID=UPI001E8E2952|nr:catalase-like domain-containing protein [Boeremia exigua]KAH6612135.1 catalase-like domain-containing protein [Boeremia exigua]